MVSPRYLESGSMSHPNKAKGTRFEREVADYLALNVLPDVDRKILHGRADHGDIANVPDWTLECKNERTLNLAGAVDEARKEADNAKTPWYAAIVKRRGRGVAGAYVVLPLEEFALLIAPQRAESH